MADDFTLLDNYLATGDQASFRALVDRHLPLIYNLARREFFGHATHAEDIAQSVFILLARKAPAIPRRKPLAAWLYQTTRYCCCNLKRIEARKIRRESEAAMLASTGTHVPAPEFDQLELLSSALAQLPETDRDLLLLRYSPAEPPIVEIASTLNISCAAAEKRIARAMEKLRAHFTRKERLASVASLPALLALQSTAVPLHLSPLVTSVATSVTTASPLATALVASFAKSIAPLKAAAVLLLALTSVSVATVMGWTILSTSPISAAPTQPAVSPLPDADALPDYVSSPLPQRTYFANMARNVFPQGIFTSPRENTLPTGWSASPDPFALGVATYDPKRKFIRITSPEFGKKIELRTSLPLKPEWHRLVVRATLTNKQLQLGDSGNAAAGLFFCPVDKNNNQLAPAAYIFFKVGQGEWSKVRMTTVIIPPDAAALNVLIRFSDAKGVLGIQRVGIMPVDEKLDPDPSQVVAMQTAVKNNDVQAITDLATADKRLLEGRNMNWDCGTPLIGAAWTGHLEAVQTLLQLGADVHATDDNGDENGGYWTAATTAAFQGHPDCFKLLFDLTPEKPDYLTPIIQWGQHQHTNGPENYQQCLDYITQKFPNAATSRR